MSFIVIYGPPGVGKLTMAKNLAKITGYKLFHNHHTQDMVYPIFGYKGELVDNLLSDLRIRVFEEAMKNNIDLIFTLCFENPQHIGFIKKLIEKSKTYKSNVFFVRLYCDFDEQCNRVESPSRKEHSTKLHSSEMLKWAIKEKNIESRMDFIGEHLEIDNTKIQPEKVAEMIREHYNLSYNPINIEFKYV